VQTISAVVPTGLSTGDYRGRPAITEPVASFLHTKAFHTAGLGIAAGLCQEVSEQFSVPIEVPSLAALTTASAYFGAGAQMAIGQGRPLHVKNSATKPIGLLR